MIELVVGPRSWELHKSVVSWLSARVLEARVGVLARWLIAPLCELGGRRTVGPDAVLRIMLTCGVRIEDGSSATRHALLSSTRDNSGIERFEEKVAFIWSIAELLRGDYKASEYGKVLLPLVVLRRLDCALESTKERVLAEHAKLKIKNVEPVLTRVAGQGFYNTSKLDFRKLLDDPEHIARNLRAYIDAFSADAKDILTNFTFDDEITKLEKAGLALSDHREVRNDRPPPQRSVQH